MRRPTRSAEARIIEAARTRLGWSQQEAALRVGVSKQRWAALISGYRSGGERVVGTPETMARLALAVGVAPTAMFAANSAVALAMARIVAERGGVAPGAEVSADQLAPMLEKLRKAYGDEIFLRALRHIASDLLDGLP